MRKQMLLLLGILLFAPHLFAQFETSEVLGTVHDASGGAISKATVTLTNQSTDIQAQTTTDDNGDYDFLNVQVGQATDSVIVSDVAALVETDSSEHSMV